MTGFSLKHISETSFNEREQMSAKQVLWRDFLI